MPKFFTIVQAPAAGGDGMVTPGDGMLDRGDGCVTPGEGSGGGW
jgi:hypothetical protein